MAHQGMRTTGKIIDFDEEKKKNLPWKINTKQGFLKGKALEREERNGSKEGKHQASRDPKKSFFRKKKRPRPQSERTAAGTFPAHFSSLRSNLATSLSCLYSSAYSTAEPFCLTLFPFSRNFPRGESHQGDEIRYIGKRIIGALPFFPCMRQPFLFRCFALTKILEAPVAQLDRALDYGSKGWGVDSSRAYQKKNRPCLPGRPFFIGPDKKEAMNPFFFVAVTYYRRISSDFEYGGSHFLSRCHYPQCRSKDIQIIYLGKPLCGKHWTKIAGMPLEEAKKRLKIPRKENRETSTSSPSSSNQENGTPQPPRQLDLFREMIRSAGENKTP